MFHEFAVDPSLLSDPQQCEAVLSAFANHPGRLVSDFPKHWIRKAVNNIRALPIKNVGPVRKQSLKNKLKYIDLITNRPPIATQSNQTFNQYATRAHQAIPFTAILHQEDDVDVNDEALFRFSDLLIDSPAAWNQPSSRVVNRNASEMLAAAEPLLMLSHEIHIIDPYLKFTEPSWSDYKKFLTALCANAHKFNFSRGIGKIKLHTSDRWGSMEKELHKLHSSFAQGITVEVKHWPKSLMHDRFLLTDVGGISYGQGFQTAQKPETVNLYLAESGICKNQRSLICSQRYSTSYTS